MKKLIYLDNAATTKTSEEVVAAMLPYFTEYYGNPSSVYEFASESKKAVSNARRTIAETLGAQENEIYFTAGGSEADNWALKATAEAYQSKGKHIITTKIEHHAILHTAEYLEKRGFEITYIGVDENGVVKVDELEKAIRPDTILISVMFANNEIGTIQPIKEIGEIAKKHGVLFHTDAVQAYGQLPINVDELHIDMLSSSGHKLNGPKGIGFLYVRKGTSISPYVDGGAQELGMRGGTENVASIVGMATALKKNCDEMQQTTNRLYILERNFIDTLCATGVDFIRNGAENRAPGNINISIRGASGEMLLHRLDLKGISISTGSACDSVKTQVSHVIKAIGVPQEYAEGTIRVSFGRDNNVEDASEVAKAIISVISLK